MSVNVNLNDNNSANQSFEKFEDGFHYSKPNNPQHNMIQERRRDLSKRREYLVNLRLDHARQRTRMAQRMGTAPRFDAMGGLMAPDLYDDGLINGSGAMYDSIYHFKKIPYGNVKY